VDTKKVVFDSFNNEPTKLQLVYWFLDWRPSKKDQCLTDEKLSCHHRLNGEERISILVIKCDLSTRTVTFESDKNVGASQWMKPVYLINLD